MEYRQPSEADNVLKNLVNMVIGGKNLDIQGLLVRLAGNDTDSVLI